MTLQQLATDFQNNLRQNNASLVLDSTSTTATAMAQFLASFPGQQLAIQNAQIRLIEQPEPARLLVTGAVTDSWNVLGIAETTIQFNQITFTATAPAEDTKQITATFDGTLSLNEDEFPATIQSIEQGRWRLTLNLDHPPTLSFADLLRWGGNAQMATYLPQGVDAFDQVTLERLELEFDPNQASRSVLSFTVVSTLNWQIISDLLTIEQIGVDIRITHTPFADRYYSSFSGKVRGVIQIGSRIFQIVLFLGDEDYWAIALLPDPQQGFPGLGDLAALAGGETFNRFVDGELKNIGFDIPKIVGVEIGFDVSSKRLLYIRIDSTLMIAGGELELKMFFQR